MKELKLVVQNAPGLARALISSHQAYRRSGEQLASLDDTLGRSSTFTESTPYEEVRDFFHFVDNHIQELDLAAERLAEKLHIPERDAGAVWKKSTMFEYCAQHPGKKSCAYTIPMHGRSFSTPIRPPRPAPSSSRFRSRPWK